MRRSRMTRNSGSSRADEEGEDVAVADGDGDLVRAFLDRQQEAVAELVRGGVVRGFGETDQHDNDGVDALAGETTGAGNLLDHGRGGGAETDDQTGN
jgi:hypothetical protein